MWKKAVPVSIYSLYIYIPWLPYIKGEGEEFARGALRMYFLGDEMHICNMYIILYNVYNV